MLVIALVGAASLLLYRAAAVVPEQVIRNLLLAAIGGLIAFSLYGLGLLPGATWLQREWRPWGAALITMVGAILPVLVIWMRQELRRQ